MTSLKWKRKLPDLNKAAGLFTGSDDEEDELVDDWRSLLPSNKKMMLEDSMYKSQRLQQEATQLAEEERYWESLNKFDEALQFTPNIEKIHEMKAQVLMEVGEIFPAVQAAEKAVHLNKSWAEAYQTLGRAQVGIGELEMALKNFCKAYHLKPDMDELYVEDICWVKELLEKRKRLEAEKKYEIGEDQNTFQNETCCGCGKSMMEPPKEVSDKT